GSPDHRISRKLSPVEIYYEMRTRRNSVTSSVSPAHSLPRSASNVEGRSVPATPLLARTAPMSVHVRPPQYSLPTPEDSTRSLHKALALEGLRDWYLRNALGYPTAPKGQEAGISRLSHPHPLVHQAQSAQGETATLHRSQIPQSASFHGHPLHGRSAEPPPGPSRHRCTFVLNLTRFRSSNWWFCLPDRSMEFSLYQETPPSQVQEGTPAEPSTDPGTLV
ncbi:unnamed protein product, partial [Tetraodon nigroviridis]